MNAEERFAMPRWFGLIFGCILAAVLLLTFAPKIWQQKIPEPAPHHARIQKLGMACLAYSVDNDDLLPPSESWGTAMAGYLKSEQLLHDTLADSEIKYGFAFYAPIGSQNPQLYDKPGDIPMIFQSEMDDLNACGDLDFLPLNPRSPTGDDLYAHVDGSAHFRPRAWARQPIQLVKIPKP